MQLHPRHFGRDLREKLVSKLMKDVEGTCRFVFLTLSLPGITLYFLNWRLAFNFYWV